MFDFYSFVPLPVIYVIGSIILLVIAWSFVRDAARADPETRRKLVKIYAGLFVGSVILVWGLGYFNVSEKLFPSFYEHEERRQQLNNPWEQNFDLEDWQQFNGE